MSEKVIKGNDWHERNKKVTVSFSYKENKKVSNMLRRADVEGLSKRLDELEDKSNKSLREFSEQSALSYKLSQLGIETLDDEEFKEKYDFETYKNFNGKKVEGIETDNLGQLYLWEGDELIDELPWAKDKDNKITPIGISCFEDEYERLDPNHPSGEQYVKEKVCTIIFTDKENNVLTSVNEKLVSDTLKYFGGEKNILYLSEESGIWTDIIVKDMKNNRYMAIGSYETPTDLDIIAKISVVANNPYYQTGRVKGIVSESSRGRVKTERPKIRVKTRGLSI